MKDTKKVKKTPYRLSFGGRVYNRGNRGIYYPNGEFIRKMTDEDMRLSERFASILYSPDNMPEGGFN